jgi:hypothetical protein
VQDHRRKVRISRRKLPGHPNPSAGFLVIGINAESALPKLQALIFWNAISFIGTHKILTLVNIQK